MRTHFASIMCVRTQLHDERFSHDHPAAHLRLPPRPALRVTRHRVDVPRRAAGCPPRRRDRALGPLGRHAAGVRPAAAAAKMAVFAGADPEGDEAAAWRAARDTLRALRLRRPLPVHACRCGTRRSPTSSSSSSTSSASRDGLRRSIPPRATPACWTDEGAAVIYTSAVYGPDRGPAFGSDFQQPYFEDWLSWAGVDDIRNIAFRPNLATADPEPGRRAAHARAAVVARGFLSPAGSALLAG